MGALATKEQKEGGPGKFAKNKKLILGGIGLIVVALAVGGIFFLNRDAGIADPALGDELSPQLEEGPQEEAEILPQPRRENEDESTEITRDPFAGPTTLKGLITGDGGGNLAIIKSGATTYVASEGELIAEHWIVDEITDENVTLTDQSGEDAILLKFQEGSGGEVIR